MTMSVGERADRERLLEVTASAEKLRDGLNELEMETHDLMLAEIAHDLHQVMKRMTAKLTRLTSIKSDESQDFGETVMH